MRTYGGRLCIRFNLLFIFSYECFHKLSLYHTFLSASVAVVCTELFHHSTTPISECRWQRDYPSGAKHGLIWVRSLCGSWQNHLWDSSARTRSEGLVAELELRAFLEIQIHPTTLPPSGRTGCALAKQWKDHTVCVLLQHIQNKWIS